MLFFIGRRLLQSLLVMLTVALIAFAMFRYVGDPIVSMVGQDTTEAQRAELRESLGLNDPFVVQYARFVRDAAQSNFGISYRQRQPVSVVACCQVSSPDVKRRASGPVARTVWPDLLVVRASWPVFGTETE